MLLLLVVTDDTVEGWTSHSMPVYCDQSGVSATLLSATGMLLSYHELVAPFWAAAADPAGAYLVHDTGTAPEL